MSDFTKYLPSSTPGMTWRLSTYKPLNRAHKPYASAVEGEQGDGFFTTKIGFGVPGSGSRHHRVMIPGGRMTAKAQAIAMAQLEAELREMGDLA